MPASVDKTDPKILAELVRRADQYNPEQQSALGQAFLYGEGVLAQDYAQAVMWFKKAAARGNDEAMLFLGQLYLDGTGVS